MGILRTDKTVEDLHAKYLMHIECTLIQNGCYFQTQKTLTQRNSIYILTTHGLHFQIIFKIAANVLIYG